MPSPKHVVAASALVTNEQGEVLLVRTPRRGWEFPGGQIEKGETIIEGLQREILEESGITAAIDNLIGIYSNIKRPPKVIYGFLGHAITGTLRTSPETVDVRWVDRASVLSLITHPAVYDRMKDMLEFSGRIIYRVYATNPYEVVEQRYV
jgi:8-oxo-dGTP diphosphatase